MSWRVPPVCTTQWEYKDWRIWDALVKRCLRLGCTIDTMPQEERTKVFEEIAPERITRKD